MEVIKGLLVLSVLLTTMLKRSDEKVLILATKYSKIRLLMMFDGTFITKFLYIFR